MYKIIALMGEAGSGKSACLKALLTSNPAYHKIVTCTTRPAREGEKDGEDYYFMSELEYHIKAMNGSMLETTTFNGWNYGTPISSLEKDKINIGVFNPEGVRTIARIKQINQEKVETKVYYLRTSDKERLLRQLNREENPCVDEIIRRFSADKEDFDFVHESSLDKKEDGIISYFTPEFFFYTLQNETVDDFTKVVKFIEADNSN
jgi:guanylate kinase